MRHSIHNVLENTQWTNKYTAKTRCHVLSFSNGKFCGTCLAVDVCVCDDDDYDAPMLRFVHCFHRKIDNLIVLVENEYCILFYSLFDHPNRFKH